LFGMSRSDISSTNGSSGTVMDTGKGTAENSASQQSPNITSSDAGFDISKIIYSGNISLYTDDYKGTYDKVGEYTASIGGFVQSSGSSFIDKTQNTTVNSGYITIRVPADKFQEAMKEIQKYGTSVNAGINSENISQQYQDIKGQLDNLKIQEQRLQEYLSKAENIQDLLAIETELNRVKTEIDYRTTMLNNWDKEISYSTIYVSITEKKLATSSVKSPFSDMFQKIKEGFIGSINLLLNVTAWFIVFVVRLVPFAAIIGAGYLIYRKFFRKKTQ
jgi:virulence-associated protein VapD